MRFLFLDTETTGTDPEDRIVQVAYILREEGMETWASHCEYFKPPVPIKVEAMAVTGITPPMVADKQPFYESEMWAYLREYSIQDDIVLVAHNASYDLGMLKKEGIEFPRHICTLKIARFLDTKGVFSSHSLQYLRYFLELYDIEGAAHDALGDVHVLMAIFKRMEAKISHQEMLEISSRPTLIRMFNFGKHKGKTVEEVALMADTREGRGYLEWLLAQKEEKPEGEEDWIYTLKYYLQKA